MRCRVSLVFGVLLTALVLAAPASAGHGTGAPGESDDMSHLGNSPRPGTTNSDIAFWGDLAYSGHSQGFRIIDVANRRRPREIVDFPCAGSQNDVGVWDSRQRGDGDKRLLFLSVDGRRNDDKCNGVPPKESSAPGPFEGIRVLDVTDPRKPKYLKSVYTECGSHTHTVIPVDKQRDGSYVIDADDPDRVLIYVSSYPLAGQNDRCGLLEAAQGEDPRHNQISIVEVPFDDPEDASVLKEVPLHPETRGFPEGESHGCHDIGAFLELELAAAACQGEGQVWDISDPANPGTQDAERIFNPLINYWHSASFTWDGKYLIYGDEEGGAAVTHGCANLSPTQPATGATWFYERSNPITPAGNFTQTRQQFTEGQTTCTAHNYIPIPVEDRYLLTSAYYEAGSSVIDFTDPMAAREIAYFDAKGDSQNEERADTWSSYWYNGNVFANDINRGVDVFELLNEPARLARGARRFDHLNPQTQEELLGAQECTKNRGTDQGRGNKRGHCKDRDDEEDD